MKIDNPAAATSTSANARSTSTPTPIIRKSRALSNAGDAACRLAVALTMRGSVAAAIGLAYWMRSGELLFVPAESRKHSARGAAVRGARTEAPHALDTAETQRG